MSNKYLEKIAEVQTHYIYHDVPESRWDDSRLARMYDVQGANELLAEKGFKPRLHETFPDHIEANRLLEAQFQSEVRPFSAKGNVLGVFGGGALGAGVGFGLAAAKVNPVLAGVAGLGTAVGSGMLAKKLYYTDDKKKSDDQHQVTSNAYLNKLLSRYEKEE